jgi:diguanylate cyclase (GGDEF)-like protein
MANHQRFLDHCLSVGQGIPSLLTRALAAGCWLWMLMGLAAPISLAAPPANLQFVHLMNDQGVSVGSVEVITQDHLGYIWIGGSDGLVQYDGYSFVTYRNRPDDDASLSSNIIWDIHEDRKGDLWIATDSGIHLFNRDLGKFKRFQHAANNSNSLVGNSTRSVAEDAKGNLWIATIEGLSRLNPERNSFTNFVYLPGSPNGLTSGELRTLLMDRDGITLWIGHYARGLNRMNTLTGEISAYAYDRQDGSGLNTGKLISIFQDSDGFIWLGTDGAGLNRLNPTKGEFDYLKSSSSADSLSHNVVTSIADDEQGNLWIATEGGLNYLDRATMKFNRYLNNPTLKYSLGSSNLHSVFVDSNHDLWVGNFPAGVNFLDTSKMVFRTYRSDPGNSNSLSQGSVLSIDEYPEGVLWLGTDGAGLNRFDIATEQFTRIPARPEDPQSMKAQAILSVQHAADGSLWMGAWHGGLNHLYPESFKAKQYDFTGVPGELSNDNIWALCLDAKQNLWIGSIGGGVDLLTPGSTKFKNYQKQYPSNSLFFVTWKIFEDHSGNIWIGTNDGLGKYNAEKDRFDFYRHDPKNPKSLSFDVVLDITEDKDKRLWIATRGGGVNVFDSSTGTFTSYRKKDGLPEDIIRSIKADNLGNLWLGSASGLTQFNPETKRVINYNEKNGLQGNLFNFSSAFKTSKGEMLFGGTEGFTIFDPEKLTANNFVPPVAIVDFQIFNKPVSPGAKNSPLTKVVSQTDSITLDHHQGVFSFSFSAMSYRNSEKNQFAYMMEGFEKDWNYVGSDRRIATYTNLNPGVYTFRVKASNNEGVWNQTGTSIKLRILPPPWKTWWAYLLYFLSVVGVLCSYAVSQRQKRRVLEERVKERTEELNQKHEQLEEAYLRLEKISLSDPLTGLSNRRYLQKLLPMDVAKVQREYDDKLNNRSASKTSVDLMFFLLDVDHFKSVNDVYGHAAGDQLLVQFSNLLTKICRETDCIVRWGGEEFLIVSRFSDRNEAAALAERIRLAVEHHEFLLGDGLSLRKTCSIGFACYPFLRDRPKLLSWEQVINTADQALYFAKNSGRNCTIGIMANDATRPEDLYLRMNKDIHKLIESGELTLISGLEDSVE